MKKLKYIITGSGHPILFGECHTHKEIARGFAVTSAWFVHIDFDGDRYIANCFGESTTIDAKSDPVNDKRDIEFILNEY